MTFLTDLDNLIRYHHGDVKKLRDIRDTIKHDNFITTDDKNYVESLITEHLKNQPLDKSSSQKKPRPKIELQSKHTKLDSKNNITSIFSSNKKLGVIGGAAAAIAIIVIVGFGATNQTDIGQSSLNLTANNTLLVNVDESNYEKADIISISGDALSNTKSVELSIENADGIKIWKEVLGTKNNGEFSTLLIAAGGGWENGGVYTLNVAQNDLTSKTQFKFSP